MHVSSTESETFFYVEVFVLLLVLLSTFALGYEFEEETDEEYEVSHISGSIELTTRSGMDSLGLDDFKLGAIASIEMDSHSIHSTDCASCTNNPTGIQMTGDVTITNLERIIGGGTGRVEGKLDVIHLREYQSSDMVSKEWLTIDWDAADHSSQWDIFIIHDPPRWIPEGRDKATFITIDDFKQSRTGPWLLVDSLMENALNVRGCLPDSFNCDGTNRQEINLTSHLTLVTPSIEIDHPKEWSLISVEPTTNETPSKSEGLRELFNLGTETTSSETYCPSSLEAMESASSWQSNSSGGVVISPMGIWLDALGLPSGKFVADKGFWSEVDYESSSCASLTNEDGVLLLGINLS